MTRVPCIVCGRLGGSTYCQMHDPERQRRRITPGRTTRQQAQFRKAVLSTAGHRCQWIDEDTGRRCTVTGDENLTAHHITPLREDGNYDAEQGVALCRAHHPLAERRLHRDRDDVDAA